MKETKENSRFSVRTAAVGDVAITCASLGAWRLSADLIRCDADVVRIVLEAPEEAYPPAFEVMFSVPQSDIRHIWHPFAENGFIPPDWDWRGNHRTSIATGIPIFSLVGLNDENRLCAACSETYRVVDTRIGLVEESGEIQFIMRFFGTPEAPLSRYETEIRLDAGARFFADAVTEASAWLSSRSCNKPCTAPPAAFDPLYSSWYAFHQKVHAADLEAECAVAAADGMRTIILDDGWHTVDESRGFGFCGDWQVAASRFPDGMAAHVSRVHALGMKYIVWYSVPFVGYKSRNFERFRGKYMRDRPRSSCSILDPRFAEVREFLASTYERALREWDIDGFKLDFIDQFCFDGEDPAAKEDFAGRDIRSLPDAVHALLDDVTHRLRAIKPDVLIEFRQHYIGPAIRAFGNMLRAADCPGDSISNRVRIANLRLTSGATAVHSDMLMWHPSATPQAAAQQVLASLFGVIQYSMRLRDLPPEHHNMMRHWIAFTQKHRKALLHGTFRPHGPASGYPVIEGASDSEAVLAIYDERAVCSIEKPADDVFVVNATGRDCVYLELPRAPSLAEAFDTFGLPAGNPAVSSGLIRITVPPSGYLHLAFS